MVCVYDIVEPDRLDCGTSHFFSSYASGAQGTHWSREVHVLLWGQAARAAEVVYENWYLGRGKAMCFYKSFKSKYCKCN